MEGAGVGGRLPHGRDGKCARMFLYELALQLDVRSSDLVDQARALGMDVGPSTTLTPEQVQHLRANVVPSSASPTAPLAADGLLGVAAGPPPSAPPPPPGAVPGPGLLAPPPPPPPPPGASSAPSAPAPPGVGGHPPTSWSAAPPTSNGHPPGPQTGPPAAPSTGGDKQLSPAMVALYFAVPIVVLLGLFAFLSKDEDDGGSRIPTASGPLGIFGPDDGATPVGDVAEVTDVEMFCDGWSMIADMDDSAPPGTYAESRAATLEVYPDLALGVMVMSRSSDGALQETANDVREHLSAAIRLHKVLPAEEAELTPSQRADLVALGDVPTVDFEYLRYVAVKTC